MTNCPKTDWLKQHVRIFFLIISWVDWAQLVTRLRITKILPCGCSKTVAVEWVSCSLKLGWCPRCVIHMTSNWCRLLQNSDGAIKQYLRMTSRHGLGFSKPIGSISEKKEKTQPLFMEWLCVLKSNRTTWLFSIPASPPSLSYTPLANLWQCRQSYYLAKITTTHNGNFCCYKTKANAKWGGERVHMREGLLHLFSGNVLFMLISHSFLP